MTPFPEVEQPNLLSGIVDRDRMTD